MLAVVPFAGLVKLNIIPAGPLLVLLVVVMLLTINVQFAAAHALLDVFVFWEQ